MAKAIVKVNAFLDKKQTKEVYDSIYGQVKAGLDVIIVPAYCDVYILDGADIELQEEEKSCSTCRYSGFCKDRYEPCYKCKDYSKWETKNEKSI